MITRNTCVADFLIEGINWLHDCRKPGTMCIKTLVLVHEGLPWKIMKMEIFVAWIKPICHTVTSTSGCPAHTVLDRVAYMKLIKWSVLTPLHNWYCKLCCKCKHRHNQNPAIYNYQFFNLADVSHNHCDGLYMKSNL